MMSKFQKLHITLDNIHELNHFVFTHSLKNRLLGQEYETSILHIEEAGFKKNPWLYRINKYGYRGKNWAFNRQSVAFFGCSFTFGIGVEKSIAECVQEKISIDCINLGQPGSASINILKTVINFLKFHPVDFVVITLPPLSRVYKPMYCDKMGGGWTYANLIPNWVCPHSDAGIFEAAFKFFSEDTSAAYLYDFIQAVEMSASVSNTTIFWSSWDVPTRDFLKSTVNSVTFERVGNLSLDKARDGTHPGPACIADWASNVTHELKKYL